MVRFVDKVYSQWRIGANGPVGFDLPAVFQIAEIEGFDIDWIFLRKINAAEEVIIKNIYKEMKCQS